MSIINTMTKDLLTMDQKLENKVAVITGGAQGLGFAIADEFLKEGAKTVFIVDTNVKKGNKAAVSLNLKYGRHKAYFIYADITTDLDEAFRTILDKTPEVDILVNNAGTDDEMDIKRMIDVNIIAHLEWSVKFLEYMRKDKGGKGGTILNITWLGGIVAPSPYRPITRATNFAMMGFSKAYGHMRNFELTGVKVVALCVAITDTESFWNLDPGRSLLPDQEFQYHYNDFKVIQDVSVVGKAAVQVIATKNSGTAWAQYFGNPIREILVSEMSKI